MQVENIQIHEGSVGQPHRKIGTAKARVGAATAFSKTPTLEDVNFKLREEALRLGEKQSSTSGMSAACQQCPGKLSPHAAMLSSWSLTNASVRSVPKLSSGRPFYVDSAERTYPVNWSSQRRAATFWVLVAALGVGLLSTACSQSQSQLDPPGGFGSPVISRSVTPSPSPDTPTVMGDGTNSVKPSGDTQTGIDATDSLCHELKRDLEEAITETLADLRDAGMAPEFMPSRNDLKKELSSALRANGCSGF